VPYDTVARQATGSSILFERAEEIRADRSTHERRLEQLLPRLVAEFADAKPAEEIRACARRDSEGVRRLPGEVVRADAGRAPCLRLPPRARLRALTP